MMVPDTVLEVSRMMAERRLDRDARLIPTTNVEDDSGGIEEVKGVPKPIRVGIAPGMGGQQGLQQQLLDRIANREYYVILCSVGLGITEDDIIEVDNPVPRTDDVITDTYRVIGLPNRLISYEVLTRVIVVRDEETA